MNFGSFLTVALLTVIIWIMSPDMGEKVIWWLVAGAVVYLVAILIKLWKILGGNSF